MRNINILCIGVAVIIAAACKKAERGSEEDGGAVNPPPIEINEQYIGSLLAFGKNNRQGWVSPTASGRILYNLPLYQSSGNDEEWWDNIVEEYAYSGMDYMAVNLRGFNNTSRQDHGDPRELPKLFQAMERGGYNDAFKIALFDDVPASWTANRNNDHGLGYGYEPKFDCGDPDNYRYIWDFNLKVAFENIPKDKLFTIDDKPMIVFWGVGDYAFTNYGNGNLKAIIEYIREECQSDFGFTPYIVADQSWIKNDPTTNDANVVDAVHDWFNMEKAWTLREFNKVKFGVLVPGFSVVEGTTNMFIDANHGKTLINGLENTKGSGALVTFIEGFTDVPENAAIFRSTDTKYYDYPNQRLNIVRRYSSHPFPDVLKVEAEGCDFFHDLTPGNSGGAYRDGDIDVVKTDDALGGWHVTDAESGEWLEWKELPLLANTKFQIRYSSSVPSSIKFTVDGVDLPETKLPVSQNWTTLDAGVLKLPENGLHTVRLTIISGNMNINYFNRVKSD